MKQLNRQTIKLETEAKRRLIIDGFDDLNVVRVIDKLYLDIDAFFRKRCKDIYCLRYWEVRHWLGTDEEDDIDDLFEMYLAGLLDEPNENTHYVYSTEILRKRDRAKEAILSIPTKAMKQIEMDKQIRYALQMFGWYFDFVSQDAEIQAFIDEGITEVERHEMNDGKTCRTCREADGDIYDVRDIPPLPHLRCRRWFTPVERQR